MYLVQMDGDDTVWLPSLCARLLSLFYDNAADVEQYTQQIGQLLLSFQRPLPLEVAVLHMAKRSVHFALRIYFVLTGSLQNAAQQPPKTCRAGRMLLCLFAVIEERAKGRSGQHDTPDDYLQRLIEGHQGQGDAPALAAITSALCQLQAASQTVSASLTSSSYLGEAIPGVPTGAAGLSDSEASSSRSVGAASWRTSCSSQDDANKKKDSPARQRLQQEHEGPPSLCNTMSMSLVPTTLAGAPGEMMAVVAPSPRASGGSSRRLLAQKAGMESAEMVQRLLEWTAKQHTLGARRSIFSAECLFVEKLVQIAESLRVEQAHLRPARLVVMLTRINAFLSSHPVYIPFGNSQEDVRQVVRVPPEHAKIFTTACRTPCWLVLETVATGKPAYAPDLDHMQRLRRYADMVGFKRGVVRDGLLPDLWQLPASLTAGTKVSPTKWLGGGLSRSQQRLGASNKSPLLQSSPNVTTWPKLEKRSPQISPLLAARTWTERHVEELDGEGGGAAAPSAIKDEKDQERHLLAAAGSPQDSAESVHGNTCARDDDEAAAALSIADGVEVCNVGRERGTGEEDTKTAVEEEFERVEPEMLLSLAALLSSESRVGVSCECVCVGGDGARQEQAGSLVPETWGEMVERLRKTSPHGRKRGFRIDTLIVKSFDDLRQEAFAMQLICEVNAVWKVCKVPVKVYPYSILPTSASAGLIEGLPEALSMDAVKKRCSGFRV